MCVKRRAKIVRVLRRAIAALPRRIPVTLAALRRTGLLPKTRRRA